jgi:hypothetical protein
MNRALALKVVNIALGVLILNQAGTGLGGDALSHEAFEVLHEGGGFLMLGLAAAHVVLNWGWVKGTLLKKKANLSP